MKRQIFVLWAGLCIAGLGLQACGGGGGGGGGIGVAVPSTATVSGTAATGAPMANAKVVVTDANGVTADTIADANGKYSINVFGMTAPLLLNAYGVSGDTVKSYMALLAMMPAHGQVVNVNVTPLTHAIVALASSSGNNPNEFSSPAVLKALDSARLKKAEDVVKAIVATIAKDVGLPDNFNLVTTPFVAALDQPGDKLLEAVRVSVSDTGVTMSNPLVPVEAAATGATATVVIANVNASPPAALPKSVVTPSYNALLALMRAQINACLALDPADRVTLNVNKEPIALKGDCTTTKLSAFGSDYFSSGRDFLSMWGPRFRDLPKEASMAQVEITGTFARDDGGTNVSLRLPVNAANGGTSYGESLRSNTSGVFQLRGNQRKYSFGVSTRLYKTMDVSSYDRISSGGQSSSAGAAFYNPDLGKNVGRLSRYETAMYFDFSILTPSSAKVYAVRVTGPGLPTAGLVLARSSACGAGNGLAMYSNNGSLPVVPGGATDVFTATTGTSGSWRMSATPIGSDYKGSNLLKEVRGWATATPSMSNYSETYFDVTTIPEAALYTWEVFSVDAPLVPEVFTSRLTDRSFGPSYAATFPWATIAPATLDYLKPLASNIKAGELTSATLAWTNAAGSPLVNHVNFSGSGRGSKNETVRFNTTESVRPVGALSMTLSPEQETDGLGVACPDSAKTIPVHSAVTGSRNVQIEQRTDNTKMIQVWQHSGRAPTAPPVAAPGSIGWNVFNAEIHPLANGSLILADGNSAQFNLNSSPSVPTAWYGSVSGGVLNFDSSAVLADTQTYRINNVVNNSGSYPKTFTMLARVAGNATTTARAMNFDISLADAGLTGSQIQFSVRENDGVRGVCIFSYDGTGANLCKEPFNTSTAHIYHIAVTLTSATSGSVSVYVDGSNTPVIDQLVPIFRATGTAGDNYLRFGDPSSTVAAMGSVDWLVWTNTGAYTPADLIGKLPAGLGVTTGY